MYKAAEHDDADRGHEHPIIAVPGILRGARPEDVDDGADPVGQAPACSRASPNAPSVNGPAGRQPLARAISAASTIIWNAM